MVLKQMFPMENWNSPECFEFAGVKGYAPMLAKELETEGVKNLFTIGDGAGVTRGLLQASASGVYVARTICER